MFPGSLADSAGKSSPGTRLAFSVNVLARLRILEVVFLAFGGFFGTCEATDSSFKVLEAFRNPQWLILGLVLGGAPGARLAGKLGMPTSPATLSRRVKRPTDPTPG